MKMYRTTSYSTIIEEREITKVTDKSVFYLVPSGREDRELISSGCVNWFNTRIEAVDFLKNRISKAIESHEAIIVRLKIQLAGVS